MPPKPIEDLDSVEPSTIRLSVLVTRQEAFKYLLAASLFCWLFPSVFVKIFGPTEQLIETGHILAYIFGVGCVAIWVPEILETVKGLFTVSAKPG